MLVVDDGSTDSTAARAESAETTVLQGKNQGKGRALRRGDAWPRPGLRAIITLDGDNRHDPAKSPLPGAAAREPYDLIIGARNFDDMPWTRYTMNSWGWTFSRLMGGRCPITSPVSLADRRLTEPPAGEEEGYEFEVEMIVICLQHGYELGWVPIRTIYNGEPSHINHVKHVFQYVRLLWRVRRQMKQLGAG